MMAIATKLPAMPIITRFFIRCALGDVSVSELYHVYEIWSTLATHRMLETGKKLLISVQ